MKLHYLGFILWSIALYFTVVLLDKSFIHYQNQVIVIKVIILFVLFLLLITGLHKIIFAFTLLVNKNEENFNSISMVFFIIGIIASILGYINSDGNIKYFIIDNKSYNFLDVTFLGFITSLLISVIFFPKTLKREQV